MTYLIHIPGCDNKDPFLKEPLKTKGTHLILSFYKELNKKKIIHAASLTAHFLLNQRGEAIPTALRKFEKMSEPQWHNFWDSQELNQWFHETFKIGPLALSPFNRQIYTPRNGELILSNETRQPEIKTPTVRILQTSHNGQPRYAMLLKLA